MSSPIITSWADWLGNIVIIYHKHSSSVDPVMISPVFSIGASVASLKCEVSGGVVLPGSHPAIIKVLIYCSQWFWLPWLAAPHTSVLCPGPGDHAGQSSEHHSDWFISTNSMICRAQHSYSTTTTDLGIMLAVSYQFTRSNKNFDRHFCIQIVNNTDKLR